MPHPSGLQRIHTGIYQLSPGQRTVPQAFQQRLSQAKAVPQGDDAPGVLGHRIIKAQQSFGRDAVQKPQPQLSRTVGFGNFPLQKAGNTLFRPLFRQQCRNRLPPLLPHLCRRCQRAVSALIVGFGGRLQGVQGLFFALQPSPIHKGRQRQIIPVAAGEQGLKHMWRRAIQKYPIGKHGPVQRIGIGGAVDVLFCTAQPFTERPDAGCLAAARPALDHIEPPGCLFLQLRIKGHKALAGVCPQKKSHCHKKRSFRLMVLPQSMASH